MKLTALYRPPADPQAFDESYFQTHLRLIAKVPGLKKVVVTRFTRALLGDGLYLMAELYFENKDALTSAMKSPEMNAAGENLNSFAAGLVTLMFGEELDIPQVV